MKNYNEMANDVLHRIGEYENKQRQKRNTLTRIGSIAACFCLAVIVGITAWGGDFLPTAPTQTTENENNSKTTIEHTDNSNDTDKENIGNWPIDYVPDRNEVKIIASYNDGMNENDLCDAVPKNGEIVFSKRLKDAMDEHRDSALYLVNVDVFGNGQHLENDSPQVESIREQLTEAGYIVAYETYFDGTESHYYFAIHAKLNELLEFEAYENYGYRLTLY